MTHYFVTKTVTPSPDNNRQQQNKTLNPCLYWELKPVKPVTAVRLIFCVDQIQVRFIKIIFKLYYYSEEAYFAWKNCSLGFIEAVYYW